MSPIPGQLPGGPMDSLAGALASFPVATVVGELIEADMVC